MEMNHFISVRVDDGSQVAEARRVGAALAAHMEFGDTETGKLALAVTEAATNQIKHAGGGDILFRAVADGGARGVEVVAVDKGPGVPNLHASLRDGYSTSGTSGTGLGAIMRQSAFCDMYSAPGKGMALLMQFWATALPSPVLARRTEMGAVAVPLHGETQCGDAWTNKHYIDSALLLIADGLGHGVMAAEASGEAVRLFHRQTDTAPADILNMLHLGMRATRGAAAAVIDANAETGVIRFAGVGNTAGYIIGMDNQRHMVSSNGTLGGKIGKIQEFTYPWPADALLIFATDGITSQLSLKNHPGLRQRHCTLIAAVLYRDFVRGHDDATVVVVRRKAA